MARAVCKSFGSWFIMFILRLLVWDETGIGGGHWNSKGGSMPIFMGSELLGVHDLALGVEGTVALAGLGEDCWLFDCFCILHAIVKVLAKGGPRKVYIK